MEIKQDKIIEVEPLIIEEKEVKKIELPNKRDFVLCKTSDEGGKYGHRTKVKY